MRLETDLFRCPQNAQLDQQRLSHDRHCLRLACPSRHVVLGASLPDQLVAADLRARLENAMAFHPRYWNERVANSSAGYNYYTWNKLHRGESIAKLTKEDTRPLPRATEPIEIDPQVRLICPVGGSDLVFGRSNAFERA